MHTVPTPNTGQYVIKVVVTAENPDNETIYIITVTKS